jgi:hypothetical protein
VEVLLRCLPAEEKGEEGGVVGADGVHEHPSSGRSTGKYIPIALSKSNKGWHEPWFYLKNDAAAPLPVFFGRLIEEVP